MKRNTPIFGFLIGLVLPVIGFMIMYLWWGKFTHHMGFGEFVSSISADHKAFAKVLTMSLLINLIPFAYCNTKRLDLISRGIFVITMIYVVIVLYTMFVW